MKIGYARPCDGAIQKDRGGRKIAALRGLAGHHTGHGLRQTDCCKGVTIILRNLVLRKYVNARGHSRLVRWIAQCWSKC